MTDVLQLTADVLQLTADVHLQAAADGKRPPRIEIVGYTGGQMRPPGFPPTVIDLPGIKLPPQTPIVADHETQLTSIIGHGVATVEGTNLMIRGTLIEATPAATQVLQLAKSGFAFQASVGLAVGQREMIRDGESATANGQTFKAGPDGLLVVRAGTLKEISVLSLAADDKTSVAIAAKGSSAMSTENLNAIPTGRLQAEARRRQADELVVQAGVAESPMLLAARDLAVIDGNFAPLKWELWRATGLVKGAMPSNMTADADAENLWRGHDPSQAAAAKHIEESVPMATTISASHRPDSETLQAALCLSAGCNEKFVGEHFDERTMNAAVSKEYRDFGLHGLLFATIKAAGKHADGHRVTSDTIRTAFEADRMLRAQGWSPVSIPGILSNSAGKILLEAYQAVPATWRVFCSVASVDDFKSHSRYRLTSTGNFEQVGPGGQLKHTALGEQTYTQQADTYGAMLAITRQDLINDDLSAFAKLPRILGRMSAITVEKVAYTLLLANTGSFFASGNNNYFEGAGTTLQISQLAVAEQTLIDQVDDNGDPVMIVPQTLLVPSTLKTTAWSLCNSTELVGTTTADALKPSGNPFHNRLTPVASPWLNAGVLTGGSDTAWYLFGNPGDVACFEMAFLRGNQFPTIETADTDFNTLGIQMRAFHDFGVAQQDPRGGCKSKGAS